MHSEPSPRHNVAFASRRALLWAFVAAIGACATFGVIWGAGRRGAVDVAWEANAIVRDANLATDVGVGAAQGVSRRGDKLYIYGDLNSATPRVGVIREYSLDLVTTGAQIQLSSNGKPLILHPTGLTWDDEFGCFLGDTVDAKGMIYQLDWERALADGDLDQAVLAEIRDDAANNGSRPEFVTVQGRILLATADYGDDSPELRLYDPRLLVAEKRSAAPGVVVHRFPCGPFNQSLTWDKATGELTCIQNVVSGRGWRLDVIDLDRAVEQFGLNGDARIRSLVFNPHDELEGYCPLPDGRSLFVTSRGRNNLIRGKIHSVGPFPSPAGSLDVAP